MANIKLHKQLLDKMANEVIPLLKKERGNMKDVKEYLYNYVLESECEMYQDDWWEFIQDVITNGYSAKPLTKMTVNELAVEAVDFIVTEHITKKNYNRLFEDVKQTLIDNDGNSDDDDYDDDED